MLGEDHPQSFSSRNNLAHAYQTAGRTSEAVTLLERVVLDSERVLGGDHPDTLNARGNLAAARQRTRWSNDATG
ncbi:tetratricopeptide repeat protein [Streptomyces nigra]